MISVTRCSTCSRATVAGRCPVCVCGVCGGRTDPSVYSLCRVCDGSLIEVGTSGRAQVQAALSAVTSDIDRRAGLCSRCGGFGVLDVGGPTQDVTECGCMTGVSSVNDRPTSDFLAGHYRATDRLGVDVKVVFAQKKAGAGIDGERLVRQCQRYYLLSEVDTVKLLTEYMKDGYLQKYDPEREKTVGFGF